LSIFLDLNDYLIELTDSIGNLSALQFLNLAGCWQLEAASEEFGMN